MANQSIQLPNVDLPGAEYLALAPNRTVALQGRRRGFAGPATITTIPAGTEGFNSYSLILETGFTLTSGIYIHDWFVEYGPQDSTGELQILSVRSGLNCRGAVLATDYGLGTPIATTLAPIDIQNILIDRDKLITARDIVAVSGQPFAGVLALATQVGVKNLDATNPHSFLSFTKFVYTRLDGLVE